MRILLHRLRLLLATCPALLCCCVATLANGAEQATPADAIKVHPDFEVELLYSVPPQEQGSWVSLTHDDRGRLIACDQNGSLYRVSMAGSKPEIEKINVDLGMAQGLLYAFDSLYVVVNDYRGSKSGLYRVTDSDGDDELDTVTLLQKINGKGEHGPHAVILSPDGKSIYFCGGNHTDLIDVKTSTVPRNWDEDQLLTRMWDAGGHAVGKMAPGGWIVKSDPDGKNAQLISIGFRNEYDIAFNTAGDLFTYDADMEWDVGSPWYRPTRINHATAGAEFGWRSGTGKWPEYYPDSVGSVVDIGPGSPTGIVFGAGAKFPAKYQRALFIADWSYGKIYAVHMEADGSTYRGTAEQFIAASPLPVTDMIVNPHDGALYFAIGGRGTQSGLYRVAYRGNESTTPAPKLALTPLQQHRQKLERAIETLPNKKVNGEAMVKLALQQVPGEDHRVRYTRRVLLEQLPVSLWQEQALAADAPYQVIHSSIALARHGKGETLQSQIIDNLAGLDWKSLSADQKLGALRAYGLSFIRLGEPSSAVRQTTLKAINGHYPADDPRINRELCQLLVYLNAAHVADRTLELLLSDEATQEEQIAYALALRELKSGWNQDTRRAYFQWFIDAKMFSGGNSFSRFLINIRKDAIAKLSDEEKKRLNDVLSVKPAGEVSSLPQREFVKKWTVEELLPAAEKGLDDRDWKRGRALFTQGACFKCHRFAGRGGIVGPDLTGVAGRFNAKNLLESIIEPNKVISDQYQSSAFQLDSGKVVVGRIVNANGDGLMVMTDMMNPGKLTNVRRGEIERIQPSSVSLMPADLLDTYSQDEVLDMLAYLKSRGQQP